MRILEMAMSAPWAMLPEAVEQVLEIAARENNPTPEALEAYRAARADNGERLSVRGNVGILYAKGPMFKHANLMTAYSGATSYDVLRRDLQLALDTPAIEAILLRIDSPGGDVSGCDELAAAIYASRGKKPITAFVSGMACSAAYWIAAAADRIVVSDVAVIGSIGVVLGITDRKKADERSGISRIEFVSSQSPGKRPDVETDEGKARVQKLVDDLGDVFVDAVAKYRGVSKATVISEFGQGGVEIGANAVKRKMVDEVGQFEATFRTMAIRGKAARTARPAADAPAPAPRTTHLAAAQSPAAHIVPNEVAAGEDALKAVAEARKRIRAFSAIETPAARLLAVLRDQTCVSVDEGARILAAADKDMAPIMRQQAADAFLARCARAGHLGTEGHLEYPAAAGGSSGSGSAGWRRAVAQASSGV